MKDGLYHTETGLPESLVAPFFAPTFGLEYGQHARRAALDDRYGQLTSVPLSHKFTRAEVFEVEVEQGRIVKFAARLSTGFSVQRTLVPTLCNGGVDLILVCIPSLNDRNNLFVKTLWLCERNDNHKTLDRSRYTPYTA